MNEAARANFDGTQADFIFAGGGTGGHIYPAIAVAQRIRAVAPTAGITFFCSPRPIDAQILSKTDFDFVPLPAKGLSLRPDRLFAFLLSLLRSYRIAQSRLKNHRGREGSSGRVVVIGIGGFASAGPVIAAHRLGMAVAMLNVDMIPGKANRFLARYARDIFVQFPETAGHFGRFAGRVIVSGCPLREGFASSDGSVAVSQLGLEADKKVLLITGASSGSASVNRAVASILPRLERFADQWQIVHLTGRANYQQVASDCRAERIAYKPVDYYDDMPSLYAAADLLVGRAGAVSIAEYAAAGVPAICLPYPYHKDRHQYLNAETLLRAGGAVIVDDCVDDPNETAARLGEQLESLMGDDDRRRAMASAARNIAKTDAAEIIAQKLTD